MNFEKNEKICVPKTNGIRTGLIRDRFIQNTVLETNGKKLEAEATAENPVYLIEFSDGHVELIAERGIHSL